MTVKQTYPFFLIFICSIFVFCSSGNKENFAEGSDRLEIIKVDLSKAREGKLSEFFEPEIEYIWLRDDSEDAQLGGLNKVFFHEDKIITLDIFGCKCIKIFDKSGSFLSKINAYGDGPEKYMDFDDAIVVGEEILLLGVYPPKLMWFSMEGKFLRGEKLVNPVGSGVFSEEERRYYFYNNTRELGEYFVESVSEYFQDTLKYFPYEEGGYYGDYSSRSSFIKNDNIYLGRAFHDTIMVYRSRDFAPKLVFDFDKYAQPIEEMKRISEDLTLPEELDFINNKAKLYFVPLSWYITDSQFYSTFMYEKESYNVFFDRKKQTTHVLNRPLTNDIDQGYEPFLFSHNFQEDKTGFGIPGKTLFKELQKKKEDLGDTGFEEYVKGKGKNFAQAAFAAKDSENPVLIVYRVKK